MQAGTVEHRRITPQASIAPVVSALFVVECDADTPVVSLPHPEPQLVVRLRPSASVTLDLHAVGAGATVHRKAGDRGQRAVVARLRHGTPASLLGGPASTIADRIVPLEDLWGAAATGYYDQAHLVAEFRALAGASPRAFLDELGAALSVG